MVPNRERPLGPGEMKERSKTRMGKRTRRLPKGTTTASKISSQKSQNRVDCDVGHVLLDQNKLIRHEGGDPSGGRKDPRKKGWEEREEGGSKRTGAAMTERRPGKKTQKENPTKKSAEEKPEEMRDAVGERKK